MMELTNSEKILCVGLSCLDYVFQVRSYPIEDSDQRCTDQYNQRGGNASNNCTVLGLLKAKPYYFGTIASTFEGRFVCDDFESFGIDLRYAVLKDASCPLSFVTMAENTGSRTIVHSNKNLPEVTLEEFKKIDLKEFSWVHFEGRNILQVRDMIHYIRKFCSETQHRISVSVEIEKIRQDLDALIPIADVVFISKDFGISKGYQNMCEAAEGVAKLAKDSATIICPWGEKGAAAFHKPTSKLFTSLADPPAKIIDTLGAGDSFIASTIYALSKNSDLSQALSFGCTVAGKKVGVKGWNGLRTAFEDESWLRKLKTTYPSLILQS